MNPPSPFASLRRVAGLLAVLALAAVHTAQGATIFVDNQSGSNAFDGLSDQPVSAVGGPVRTITRALRLAVPGDRIVLANTGLPYRDSLTLSGVRHSGVEYAPFTIEGNGAVVTGAEPIPLIAWQRLGENLWRVKPVRKGHYQLLLGDEPAPEHACPPEAAVLPEIPAGHWCAWKGAIYYRTHLHEQLPNLPFSIAARDVGLTLLDVHHVRIVDVSFRGYRLDGVHAFDGCRNVTFENVSFHHNGRAGLVVGGTSHVTVRNSVLSDNRIYQLLIRGLGTADLDETHLSEPAHIEE